MNEQRIEPTILILDAIGLDRSDAKITLDLIERLTEQGNDPQTFSDKEFQTLIRNCTHAIVLHFTKTVEKPTKERHNLKTLIDRDCRDEDKAALKVKFNKIWRDPVYSKISEYRNNIIAHRGKQFGSYEAVKQEFTECRDYLIQNTKRVGKLIDRIFDLQVKIKNSRNKKRGLPSDSSSDSFVIAIRVP